MMRMLPVFLAMAMAFSQSAAAETRSSSSQSSQSSNQSSSQSSNQASQSSSSSSRSTSVTKHVDQDEARDALRKGRIMPLTAILEIVTKREPGTVMEVELETKDNKLTYRIEVLNDKGRRREIRLDARDGDVLWRGDD